MVVNVQLKIVTFKINLSKLYEFFNITLIILGMVIVFNIISDQIFSLTKY